MYSVSTRIRKLVPVAVQFIPISSVPSGMINRETKNSAFLQQGIKIRCTTLTDLTPMHTEATDMLHINSELFTLFILMQPI
jgi:hypothetical protein